MSRSWIQKHAPLHPDDVPQQDVVRHLTDFIHTYKQQKKKAALLYGPPGSCKTSAVYTIANHAGLEVVEVNASDVRNAEQIQARVGEAIKQQSLLFSSKIILIDEVDGVAGRKDRGGIAALQKLIASSTFPIILTANDPWDKKFSGLRRKAVMLECAALSHTAVCTVLKSICTKENVAFDEAALKTLARMAGGDLRAAINDLQSLAQQGGINRKQVEELAQRLQKESLPAALVRIFKTTDPVIAVGAFDHVDQRLDECMLWITENLPKEYTNARDLYQAFDAVSKADVYAGRIRRWQYWRFLVYVNTLLSAGVAVAKQDKYRAFVKYTPTTRLLRRWQLNMKYQKRKAISEKMAAVLHTSVRRVVQDVLPYIGPLCTTDSSLAALFDLDDIEVDWLKK